MAGTAWWHMGKYFFRSEERHGDRANFTGPRAHHLINVMRVRVGHRAILCDGMNSDYDGEVASIHEKPAAVTFTLLSQRPSGSEPPFPLNLFQGMPKGDKMEWIIEKAIECGATKIVPVYTARSVAKIKDAAKKAERYSRIAESAAAQSMRGIIPAVPAPQSFSAAVNCAYDQDHLHLVAYEKEGTTTVKSALSAINPGPITLWVGPEGGFEGHEVQTLMDMGAKPISLGPRILRTETAAIVAISQILCLWEP